VVRPEERAHRIGNRKLPRLFRFLRLDREPGRKNQQSCCASDNESLHLVIPRLWKFAVPTD